MLIKIIQFVKQIVDYILPPRCISCSEFTITTDSFCNLCWQQLSFISAPYCDICGRRLTIAVQKHMICGQCAFKPPTYNKARSLLQFDEHSQKIIHAFKYYDKTQLASCFARLLCERYRNELIDIDLIVPVPMHKLKRLIRKYNQSQILAKNIAQILNKPANYYVLIKSRWTKSQTTLSKAARKTNIAGSISINRKYCIQDKNILLIDDVRTTSVTLEECSKVLSNAGAKSIHVLTIATT